MTLRTAVSALIEIGLRIAIKLISRPDTGTLDQLPQNGPMIIIFNHVNFLEVPLLYLKLQPRKVHYLAKSETWNRPFMGWMADNWYSVRVERYENPLEAFGKAREYLNDGHILLISPEGSRSEDGVLRRGRGGTAVLALQNDAIIIPVGHSGAEKIPKNLKRLVRTRVKYSCGRPFRLKGSAHPEKRERMLLTEALMRELAVLLPPEQRGIYAESLFDEELVEYV